MHTITIDYKYNLQLTSSLSIIYINVYNLKLEFLTIVGYIAYK